jgi:hypothetical protein
MAKFKQFERYPTRNGGTALILNNGYPLHAASYDSTGVYEGTRMYNSMGHLLHTAHTDSDIIPPEPEKRTGWLNVYRNKYTGHLFIGGFTDARDGTSRLSAHELVGCHRITIRAEFEDDD